MTNGEQSHEPAMPSSMPLHESLEVQTISEEEPMVSTSGSSSVGSRRKKKSSSDSLSSSMHGGTTVHRIREYRQRRRASMGGGSVVEEEKSTSTSGASSAGLNVSNHSSGNTIHRIREYRLKRKESMGDHQGLDGSSTHSITWQRHASTRRLDMLSESNEMEENPLLSPGSSIGRKKYVNRDFSGVSSRRLNRDGSGTSTRTLNRGGSGTSTRTLNRGTSGASTRRLNRDASGASTRRLTRDGSGVSTRSMTWSRNSSPRSTPRKLSHHASNISGTASERSHSNLSRTQQRRRQLSEHLKANNNNNEIGSHNKSPTSSIDESASFDSLPSNSNVKGTTLELLALIKKRRQARANARGRGRDERSSRASLSPVPARKERPPRRRSISFSPRGRNRKKSIQKQPIPEIPDVDHDHHPSEDPKKWSYSAHSMSRNKSGHSSNSTFHNSVAGDSVQSFHNEDEEEENVPKAPSITAKHNDDSGSDDDDSHDSPKGVMDYRDQANSKKSNDNAPEIDPVHQEKMKRMRAEMEDLQEQLGKMEEAKAQDMKELEDNVQQRKSAMMDAAKKKIQTHLDSEMELKLYAMGVEKSRLSRMQNVLERDKEELKNNISDVQADIKELMQENKRLDEENKEIHRMYTHLSKWVMKTTKQNEKLAKAEEKLEKIHNGSIALVVEEKLSIVYRKCMYKVAQGVNCCNDFDFELNEDVWDMIKDVEQECEKEVIELHDIDNWEKELKRKKKASKGLVGMRISYGLDDDDHGDEGISASIRTRSTFGSMDLDSIDMSIDVSRRRTQSTRSSGVLDNNESCYFEGEAPEEYYSETEVDEEFEEDLERLNDSVEFYENVLAEVSVSLDANQMNTLHDNKDMLLSIFKFMDVDGSGDIDLEEFKVGIELLNKRLPADSHFDDAEELFKMLDVDNSGTIDLEEFERVFGDED